MKYIGPFTVPKSNLEAWTWDVARILANEALLPLFRSGGIGTSWLYFKPHSDGLFALVEEGEEIPPDFKILMQDKIPNNITTDQYTSKIQQVI